MASIDVLVREGDYAAARAALSECGWQLRSSNVSEASFSAPGRHLALPSRSS